MVDSIDGLYQITADQGPAPDTAMIGATHDMFGVRDDVAMRVGLVDNRIPAVTGRHMQPGFIARVTDAAIVLGSGEKHVFGGGMAVDGVELERLNAGITIDKHVITGRSGIGSIINAAIAATP